MNKSILKKLIKEEIKNILREGENEQQNYMFFQNLHTIKRMVEKMMQLNPQEVDALLSNGHAWAVDHISTATDDITEVGTWLCNELGHEMNTPNMMSESTHPWYTSSEGYYKGHSGIGMGPKSTYNVEAYLKPYETVYNDAGEVKTIKNLGDLNGKHKDSHITFTDDTEDLFLNWFPAKPELYRKTSKFHNNPDMMSETDSSNPEAWEKSGFKSKEEYNKFLDTKMKNMMNKIKSDPKLLNVFKRLKDK